MRIERLNKKKEVIFEEHSKDYVIAKQKIINKFWWILSTIFTVFIYTNHNYILQVNLDIGII